MTKVAALLAWILGFGFGLPCLYGIRYFAQHGWVWTFLGYPTYGEGLFERLGIRTSVPLLTAFLLVCGGEIALGWLLWRNRRGGRVLSVTLLPLELIFWAGFLLPFGPLLGLPRTALVLIDWARA